MSLPATGVGEKKRPTFVVALATNAKQAICPK
jgi:hypothetical protein